ncbi:MAG: DUF1552 domain-containing protein [Myxococcaceae bacterium]|nr:DUF1552 domain-containing protein [Myxococcaceae bacterium]
MNRRSFLKGLGGVTLWLPVLESLTPRAARAQAMTPAKRLLVFFECNGVRMDKFFPKTSTTGALTAAHLAGTALEPLTAHIPNLLVARGINMAPRGWAGTGCDHQKGMGHKLTARALVPGSNNFAGGPSVDQVLAAAKNPAGRPALTLAVGTQHTNVLGHISYTAAERPVKGENNPWYAYRSFMSMGMTGTPDAGQAMVDVAQRRKSVIDLVRDDFDTLKAAKLSTHDRQKLDLHLTSIRELEMSMTAPIGGGGGGGGMPAQACSLATADASAIQALNNVTVTGDSYFRQVTQMQLQIMALAVACNYTVSGTLLLGSGSGGPLYSWDGITSEYRHHALSHRSSSDAGNADLGADGITRANSSLFSIDTWHAKQFAYLLDRLAGYTDVDGSTVLSNTAAVWTNELSDGQSHNWQDLPFVIGGGLGGYLKQGQFVNVRGNNSAPAFDAMWEDYASNGNVNQPHNALWATMLNGAGVPTAHFGATGDNAKAGEIAAIKA